MYAITETSYRAIASSDDVQPGETAVETLPGALLMALLAADLRQQRDAKLTACDWTQGVDSPLDATTKAEWASYRTQLRNFPAQTGFPNNVTWPTPP
jgi:hypothetical protein